MFYAMEVTVRSVVMTKYQALYFAKVVLEHTLVIARGTTTFR